MSGWHFLCWILFSYFCGAASASAVLAPGSQLRIFSEQDHALNTTVDLDWAGEAQLPLCGRLKIAGLSLDGATSVLQSCLRKFYKQVPHVALEEILPRQFLIKVGLRGEAAKFIRVSNRTSIQTLLAAAGVVPVSGHVVRLLSPHGFDLVAAENDPEWGRPFAWRGGETVILERDEPEKRVESIDILGEVRRPGKLEYNPSKRILDVIREAQGPTPQAVLDNVIVYRGLSGQKIETQWLDPKIKIEPGDVLLIPAQRETSLDKGLRWTISMLSIVNTVFLIRLSGR